MSVSIWLPWPPSTNNLFSQGRVGGKIRRFPSTQYKRWRKVASGLIMAARIKKFTEPVVIKLHLNPPDSRPRDADNYTKAVVDSLVQGGVIEDDDNRYVRAVVPMWMPQRVAPGVIVEVRTVKEVEAGASCKPEQFLAILPSLREPSSSSATPSSCSVVRKSSGTTPSIKSFLDAQLPLFPLPSR